MWPILAVLCLFQGVVLSLPDQKTGFLVTAPRTLLTESQENICISLHNNTGFVKVSVTLLGSSSSQVLAESSLVINSSRCLGLFIPPSEEDQAKLVVHLHSEEPDLSGSSEETVKLQRNPLVVLVATDKPLYKPGQDVLFRVLSLDLRLKPHNGKISRVWVETPSGVRVQQWTEVEVVQNGLVQLQFTLDDESFLGDWKIKVQHNSSSVVEKTFTVKEFVPQKFNVEVRTLADIFPDAPNVTWAVCAKYSYGEVVQGEAHLEIQLQGLKGVNQPSINHVAKLDTLTGCVEVVILGSELGLSEPRVYPSSIQVVASVTEKGTNVSYSTTIESAVHKQQFGLKFQCSEYFKPGIPYKGNVVMTRSDGGPRLGVGEKIQVCVKARYRGSWDMRLLHCMNYTTDFSSQVVFALPDIDSPFHVELLNIIASAPDYPTKRYPDSYEVMMMQPSVTQTITPWYSPSHSYVDLRTLTIMACGTTHMVSVYYSVPDANASTPLFYYLIEGRGDLLLLDSLVPAEEVVVHTNEVSAKEVSVVRSWKLPIKVTPEMSPQSRLTVYYVRSDGEVVAASTKLTVDRCFQNKVRVRWEEPRVSPRETAKLSIRASPHSICGVSATDRQISFSASDSTPEFERVWSLLNKFNLPKIQRNQWQYCMNKREKEEQSYELDYEPPDYELRRRRRMFLRRRHYEPSRRRRMFLPRSLSSEKADSITAFYDFGVTVISNLVLETRPCHKSFFPDFMHGRSYSRYPNLSMRSGMIASAPIFENAIPLNVITVAQSEPSPNLNDLPSLVRDYFPDTWIWSLVYTGKEGEVAVNSSAPDTITSWDTKVLCVSEKEGLGVAAPTAISVFMPFFVQVDAPYSMKKGETVTVKIIVYNYMPHSLPITLTFPEKENENLHITPVDVTRFCLKELSPYLHVVNISAKTAGTVNLTVQAWLEPQDQCGPPGIPEKSDSVVKQLLVKHEGFEQGRTQSVLICPSQDSPTVSWEMELPAADQLVKGSARLRLSAVGDLFGPALENLDSLVELPTGCGEQNLAKLAPNLFVLKYLDALGNKDKKLRDTALNNIKKGYQRQLTFQRKDGSFSAFGERDESGSMWLTSAVVKTLSEAKNIIDIDTDKLQSAVVWVTRQQLENGCFPAVGQLFQKPYLGEIDDSTTALSALVVANLATSQVMLPLSLKTNAEFCLNAAVSSPDPYTVAVATLALTRLGLRQRALDALQTLMTLAIIQNDFVHWGNTNESVSENIVMTSYAVLALVELGGSQNLITARKAVRWISTHRNEHGGFVSTQDTVVALEALTAYMTALSPVDKTELMVLVQRDKQTSVFRMSEHNKLVQQQLVTDQIPQTVSVAVTGTGCALVQSALKYNVKSPAEGSQLDLQVSSVPVTNVDPCSVQDLRLCAKASNPGQVTSMALLTVMMLTGYSPDKTQLSQISHPHIKKWEEEDDQISFYLSDVSDLAICLTLRLVRKFEVEDALPAPVTLIDYYRPEISTSQSYALQCSSVVPLAEQLVVNLASREKRDQDFGDFTNVDHELEVPDGDEGPKPVYVKPSTSTVSHKA